MRFLTAIKSAEDADFGPPPASLFAAIAAYGEEAARDGTLLDQGGLLPTSQGVQIRLQGGKVTVTDGPFTEATEVIGGYAMFQLRSLEEAVELGRRFMEIHAEHWPEFVGTCEVRQIMDAPPAG